MCVEDFTGGVLNERSFSGSSFGECALGIEAMIWDVVSVQPIAPLLLAVRFEDGTEGRVRFEASHLSGVFGALKAPEVFWLARVEEGAVTWPGEIDLAPDAMYREIRRTGEWVLR
jgi:hypothetical protein